MSDEYYRMNDIVAKMSRGSQTMNVVLTGGARAILMLLQHIYRMHNEKLLSGGEVESFEKFLKATKGNFDIVNVPCGDSGVEAMETFKADMDRMGIRYHVLPDLDAKDGRLQVCVYQNDASRFAGCFRDHIEKQLVGGEMAEKQLLNLTDGHASMVSIPAEEKIQDIRKDFDDLKINYAVMPDLRVGDGQVQVLVANHDLPRMKQWYRLFRQDMMKSGKKVPDFRTISMDEYRVTAEMRPEEYINTATDDLKARLEKYQSMEKSEFAQAIDALEDQIGEADTFSFEKFLKDDAYEMLSVDHKTLVEPVDISAVPESEQNKFICRIPGLYGENEHLLAVPKDQVFKLSTGGRERYLVFIGKEAQPNVFDKLGKKAAGFANGIKLMEHFDKVKETMAAEQLQKISEMAQKLTEEVKIPEPVMTK